VHSACNQCNQGASSLTCQGVAHARVEEAGLLRTCGEAGRGAVVSTRMRALKRRVCCAPPTSVYRSRRISGSVSSTTRASYLHAISRNQSQSETHLGEGDHTSRVGRTAEIGAPAGSIKGNQGRSHLGDRTLASAGRTAEIGAPAGSIMGNQGRSHLGDRTLASAGRTAEIGAPAGSIMGNQGRSHLGDRTLASAGRTAEIGAPAGSTALTRASAEPAAALAPS
jgi:hypothetical protein